MNDPLPRPQSSKGTLYLIPTHLSESAVAQPSACFPAPVISRALTISHYVAENAKIARAFLKSLGATRPLSEISIVELDKHAPAIDAKQLLQPLIDGHDVGLVSDAGAPAVADPGAMVVAAAHAAGVRVVPLVGPSSLLLGLMASGLNGQRFAFHGYLPHDKAERIKAIQQLEKESRQKQMTQMFIETPYRNAAMLADMVQTLSANTSLCVATDLTGSRENVTTLPVSAWKGVDAPIDKLPTLFLFLAR